MLRENEGLSNNARIEEYEDGLQSAGSSALVPPSTNLYIDYNPSNLALSNNDPVSTLTDSVAARNGTAAGTQRPLFKTNAINGLPAISFDGIQQWFDMPSLAALTAATVHLVVKNDTDPQTGANASGLWNLGGDTNAATRFPFSADGHIYEQWGTNTRKDTGDPAVSLASWHIYSLWSAPNDYATYFDGTLFFTTAVNGVAFVATPTLGLSTQPVSQQFFFEGRMGRMLLYSTKQSAGDFAATIAALKQRYGIT